MWARAEVGDLANEVVVPRHPAIPPTPKEADVAADFALTRTPHAEGRSHTCPALARERKCRGLRVAGKVSSCNCSAESHPV